MRSPLSSHLLATLCCGLCVALLVLGCIPSADGGGAPAAAGTSQDSRLSALLAAESLGEPTWLEGLGGLSMKISTTSATSQRFFDQGLALLHGFWDFEARRAFLAALRHDSEAAMAWWGLYMSLNYNQHEHPGERTLALDHMEQLRTRCSIQERYYLDALLRLNGRLAGDGQDGFLEAMHALLEAYPEDVDGHLFLVKFLLTDTGGYFIDPSRSAEDGLVSAATRSVEILTPLVAAHSDNFAVHHYWIHAHEYGDPSLALRSAEKIAALAPGMGHIRHMPGHVYFLLGDHRRARASFLDAYEYDRRYLEESGVEPADHWNYIHNLDYLVATCSEDGRYREGLRWAEEVGGMKAQPHRHKAAGQGFLLYAAETAAARLHMRYGAFGAAADSLERTLAERSPPSDLAVAYLRGLVEYCRGMEAVRQGDGEAAGLAFQQLTTRSTDLRNRQAEPGGDWYFGAAKRLLVLATFELNGNILSLLGRHEQAVEALERAVEMERQLGYWEPPHYSRPVLESLGEAHLRAGRPAAARRAFEGVLELRPGSGHAWFGIARSWVLEGDETASRQAMQQLLETWSEADPELPQIRDTRAWLAANPE